LQQQQQTTTTNNNNSNKQEKESKKRKILKLRGMFRIKPSTAFTGLVRHSLSTTSPTTNHPSSSLAYLVLLSIIAPMLRSNQNFSAQRLLVVGSVLVAVAVVMVSGGIIPFENRQLGENANQYSGSFFRSNQRTIRHHMAMITKDDSHGDIDPFIHFDRMSNHAPLAWFSRCNSHHAGNAHSKPKPKPKLQPKPKPKPNS
jgi:hypothetical protein